MACTRFAMLAFCLLAASAFAQAASSGGRHLLQDGVKTAIIISMNTMGNAVQCVNITLPFSDKRYGASGSAAPNSPKAQELAKTICDDVKKAGEALYEAIKAGGDSAKEAVQALRLASCSDASNIANSITQAAVVAQEKSSSPSDVEGFVESMVDAASSTGIPTCVTLLVSDETGKKVAAENYFQTY